MADILIRDVPADVVAALEAKADAKGRTLEEEVRAYLLSQRLYTAEEAFAFAQEVRSRQKPSRPMTEAEEEEEGLR